MSHREEAAGLLTRPRRESMAPGELIGGFLLGLLSMSLISPCDFWLASPPE